MVLTTVIISRGGQDSLRLARERLGADVVVVPRGSVTGVEGALLLGNATNTYMPRGVVDKVVHGARRGAGLAAALPHLDGQLLVLLRVADVHVRVRPGHRLHHRAVAQGEARARPAGGSGRGRLRRLRPRRAGQDQALRLRLRPRRQPRADGHQPRPDAVHDVSLGLRHAADLQDRGQDGTPGAGRHGLVRAGQGRPRRRPRRGRRGDHRGGARGPGRAVGRDVRLLRRPDLRRAAHRWS